MVTSPPSTASSDTETTLSERTPSPSPDLPEYVPPGLTPNPQPDTLAMLAASLTTLTASFSTLGATVSSLTAPSHPTPPAQIPPGAEAADIHALLLALHKNQVEHAAALASLNNTVAALVGAVQNTMRAQQGANALHARIDTPEPDAIKACAECGRPPAITGEGRVNRVAHSPASAGRGSSTSSTASWDATTARLVKRFTDGSTLESWVKK